VNLKEIEVLKSILVQLTKKGCELSDSKIGVYGRIVGVGFKPLWGNPTDSKIDRIEFNYIDTKGAIKQFVIYNIVGYEFVSADGDNLENSHQIALDILIYSPTKTKASEPYDKVHLFLNALEIS